MDGTEGCQGISRGLLCPFHEEHPFCDGDQCALWDDRMEACAFWSLMVMMKKIASNIKDGSNTDLELVLGAIKPLVEDC